jgi:uncharacterized RDD family membrane protein YckC
MEDQILDTGYTGQTVTPALASFWSRVGASLVDFLVFVPIIGLSFYNMYGLKSLALNMVLSITWVLYKPLMEWKYGATLGKMALKLRVVTTTFEPISFDQSALRFSLYFLSYLVAGISSYLLFTNPAFENAGGFMEVAQLQAEYRTISMISNLVNLLVLVSVLFVAFDKKNQALHDKIADTLVVRTA